MLVLQIKGRTTLTNRKPIMFILLILLTLFLIGCRNQEPIKVGFVAELTGRRSGIGVEGRDGAQLAVDTINENGGINGRMIELVTLNNEGDPEKVRAASRTHIEQGAVAIIGHMTSGQTSATFDLINEEGMVMISPTAASDDFSGQADNFFRVMPATTIQGKALAQHIYETRGLREITGVYDLANHTFSETMWIIIKNEFERLGGKAETAFPFTAEETDIQALAGEIVATNPKSLVFVSSDIDTALLSQHIRQQGNEAPLFSSGWALTDELPAKGGTAVENLEILSLYNPGSSYQNFVDFSQNFEERYNRLPGFGAAYAYEAVLLLAAALEETNGDANGLVEALTSLEPIAGVQGEVSLDEFGDINREVYIAIIQDGDFHFINAITVPQ